MFFNRAFSISHHGLRHDFSADQTHIFLQRRLLALRKTPEIKIGKPRTFGQLNGEVNIIAFDAISLDRNISNKTMFPQFAYCGGGSSTGYPYFVANLQTRE